MSKSDARYAACVRDLGLPEQLIHQRDEVVGPVASWVANQRVTSPFFVGVSGAQGSGKSTFCRLLSTWLEVEHGLRTVELSMDDVYLRRVDRLMLAESVHPLCAIRGVPGTHDVPLARAVLDACGSASSDSHIDVPRFDKRVDDRLPVEQWDRYQGRPDVVLFEGWCMGVTVPPPSDRPTNPREAREDPDGIWRQWSDDALRDDYGPLFDRMDAMIMIQVPSMDTVRAGRWKQEQALWVPGAGPSPGRMTEAEVNDFVDLFERHTRHILNTLPDRADVLIRRSDDLRHTLVRLPEGD